MELQGARSSYFDRTGTVTLLALANVLVMHLRGQQTARVPGVGGQGSWVKNGASQEGYGSRSGT